MSRSLSTALAAALGSLLAGPVAAGPGDDKPAGSESGKPAAGAIVVSLGAGAEVDWTRGLLIATGAAAGDLRAPSPEVARVKAERQARDAARTRLRRLARDLALADGRELGAALHGDVEERFDRALDQLVDQQIEHASDGSVVLATALPLEAARAAVYGASEPASAEGPTAIVIEAGRHLKRPAIGVKLAAGDERYAGPTVFASRSDSLPGERIGARPIRAKASGYRGGALQLGRDAAAQLAEAKAAGALVVIELAADRRRDDDKDKNDRRRTRADKEKKR
jgi:hypothetical protein